jgi:uncharacterized membrane protein YGL010W
MSISKSTVPIIVVATIIIVVRWQLMLKNLQVLVSMSPFLVMELSLKAVVQNSQMVVRLLLLLIVIMAVWVDFQAGTFTSGELTAATMEEKSAGKYLSSIAQGDGTSTVKIAASVTATHVRAQLTELPK